MREAPQITAEQAAALVPDGASLMVGGFGMTGYPVHLVHALAETSTKNLTYIGNNAGEPNLGVGPSPVEGGALDYPVNAGKIPVTALPGSSYFDSSDSFAMIRGGHVDVAIMGGLQVDEKANLANWAAPGKPLRIIFRLAVH